MDKNLLKEYRAGWAAVAEVKKMEHQTATIAQRWQKFNSIIRLAAELGLRKNENKEEIEAVRQRWIKLKGLL